MTRSGALAFLLPFALGCAQTSRLPRAVGEPAVLEVRGALRGGPFAMGEAGLAGLPRRSLQGVEPGGRAVRYEGLDLAAVLADRVVLEGGADTLVVWTADREGIPVLLSLLRELRPVLADRADGVVLPGRILAWPNVEHHGMDSDPRAALWWVRKVVALELVDAGKAYGRALRVPEGAPEGALAGAGLFGARCIGCHQLRGQGGGAGPDLSRAGASLSAEGLRTRLAGHPGWVAGRVPPPGERGAAELLAFLRTVARLVAIEERGQGAPAAREGAVKGE
jgi:mono/diheme cytochrome c family protein